MTKLKTIIVDDMPLAIASLNALIDDHFSDRIEVVATATGVIDAARKVKEYKPEVLFLDIRMNDGDGFDLLDIINLPGVKVIFTTGSKEYAIKAFRYAAVDYLLKPISRKELEEAIQKIDRDKNNAENESAGILTISSQESLELIELNHIVRLEAQGNYTLIYLDDGSKRMASKTLKVFEKRLDKRFIRSHQSHLVNTDFVKSFEKSQGGYLLLMDNSNIPVSHRRRAYVIDKLRAV